MKRLLVLTLALLLFVTGIGLADDTGIQIIGGPEEDAAETVNLDDIKADDKVSISGFGDVTIRSAGFQDTITTRYGHGYGGINVIDQIESGNQSEFYIINFRILNTQKESVDFTKRIGNIACNFGDDYQFGGWYRQRHQEPDEYWPAYDSSETSYKIRTLYEGRYVIAVTLPNHVRDSKEPLSITFKLGDSEFTYHVRK